MCGIAGFLNLDREPASPLIIRKMTDVIAHRGPDGEGWYVDGPVALGHRRLAIIDLSPAGHQPMMTPDRRYIISYNGEVYNFLELRAELEALGHQFHSRTDTEVVLHAFIEWGEQALDRFNGMFAFAIWDFKRQELFLARDRYGIKPLYYSQRNDVFAFGSEIKAIIAHPNFPVQLDKEALVEYFTFQNFFTDRTLFKDAKLLPAGCFLRISREFCRAPQITRYWDFNFQEPDKPLDEREYVEELDRLFKQAVKRQLVSDVEVGSYLSGGMDSGSITAIAASQLPYLKTFTVGFDLHSASGLELSFDEREAAEMMSYSFKTEHYEMVLKAGDMERCMQKLVWHLEEPRVGQSYPNYYAAQLASKFVKVVLSGCGGDELFGGYPWRYYRAVDNLNFEDYIDKYYLYWQRLINNQQIKQIFQPIWSDVNHVWTRDIFRDVFNNHVSGIYRPEDYVNHSLYFEAKTFLHGLLIVDDKHAMAHGLECRVPFLDNDLVDFAVSVPVRCKLAKFTEIYRLNENEPGDKPGKYYMETRDGKLLLREVMKRHIPDAMLSRKKQGFSAPDASWFKGESIDYLRRTIFNKKARLYDFLDVNSVQRLVQGHIDGSVNRRLFIWSLLYLENFLSVFQL